MRRIPAAVLLATLYLVPASAQAGTFIGAICIRSFGPIEIDDGYVEFQTGKVGIGKINCAIDPFLLQGAAGRLLRLTYRDSTGIGTGAHVKSSLVSIDKSNGARARTLFFNSNQFAATGATARTGTTAVAGINTTNRFYFFEVELKRSTTSQIAGFYAGELVAPP